VLQVGKELQALGGASHEVGCSFGHTLGDDAEGLFDELVAERRTPIEKRHQPEREEKAEERQVRVERHCGDGNLKLSDVVGQG